MPFALGKFCFQYSYSSRSGILKDVLWIWATCNVELENDDQDVQMGRNVAGFGNNLDERMLENIFERPVKNFFLMQQNIKILFWNMGPKVTTAMVNDILEQQQQQQNLFIFYKEQSGDKTASASASKSMKKKGKDCHVWTSKGSCSKGGRCSYEHYKIKTRKRKRRPIKKSFSKRYNSVERKYTKKTDRRPSGKKDRPPCFDYKRDTPAVDISRISNILTIAVVK